MRVTRTSKRIIVAATLAPLLSMVVPTLFTLLISLGLRGQIVMHFNSQLLESIGWSLFPPTDFAFSLLHVGLTVFFLPMSP